ncbi:MAG TPA: cyclopropane-fatty-acyl-phospholipid synthase family protein [Solirubrobacteraceae bacterium]|nr:cyclopropane-fatty-acyl-phospholipid synthase family protein [Solirubrobacteraceae bacterium]
MPRQLSGNGSDPLERETERERSTPVAARVRRMLEAVAGGALGRRAFGVRFWDGSVLPATEPGPSPTLVVRDPRTLAYLLRAPGQLGLGRAWVSGALEVEGSLEQALALRYDFQGLELSLVDRVRAARCAWRVAGRDALRRPPTVEGEARSRGRRHSPQRDRAAVRHHYDTAVAFYRLVLGPSLVYSCAYFASGEEPLESAQERKLESICRKLSLWPGDRLLDIGCGWGSLILHAVINHGVRAVGVTVSPAQAEVARERIQQFGIADRCEVRVADYRELEGEQFDAIASVGMYEHIGRGQLDAYVRKVRGLLRPGGLFLNQGIARLTPGRAGHDSFIDRFVFPDGELHPVTELLGSVERAGLELRDLESLREHYPLTLRRWLANLAANRAQAIEAAGRHRERIFRLYMTGAAAAFERAELSVFQTLALRPGQRHRLPLTRALLTGPPAQSGAPGHGVLVDGRSPVRAT